MTQRRALASTFLKPWEKSSHISQPMYRNGSVEYQVTVVEGGPIRCCPSGTRVLVHLSLDSDVYNGRPGEW